MSRSKYSEDSIQLSKKEKSMLIECQEIIMRLDNTKKSLRHIAVEAIELHLYRLKSEEVQQ